MEVFARYMRATPTPCRTADVKRLHYVTRVMHTHEAIEFVYVISGKAEHTLFAPDGTCLSVSQVKKGNYYVIEPGFMHSYSDGSDDFCVINIMVNANELVGPDAGKGDLASVLRVLFSSSDCEPHVPFNDIRNDTDLSYYMIFEKAMKWKSSNREGLNLYARSAAIEILCKMNADSSGSARKCLAEEIREYIDVNYASGITLSDLSARFNYSASYICREFRRHFGYSYDDYLRKVRMTNACELLIGTDFTVEKISEICSYSSAPSFRRAFTEYFGMTPGQYRRQYRGK